MLKNIKFCVADDNCAMACEEMLIGLQVLPHLRVNNKMLLEASIHTVDGTDCSLTDMSPSKIGKRGRLMTARLNRKCNEEKRPAAVRPRVDYHTVRQKDEPLPDPSLLDPIDVDQHEEIRKAVEDS